MWEHAQGTKKGESGENIATDIATTLGKIYYRMSHAGSTLYATDEKGEVLYHTEYDPWGNPQGKTKVNINFSPIENFNNFTGYTYDETLGIYYAQARFYNPEIKRFTSEDPVKDGLNWYAYVGNNPVNNVDLLGLRGEVIFMQHGLGSSAQEFEETVRELKKKTNKNGMLKYKSLGIVSKRGKTTQNTYKDISFNVGYFRAMKMCMANSKISDLKMGIPHYLDQITADDTNVIIRTEFSAVINQIDSLIGRAS